MFVSSLAGLRKPKCDKGYVLLKDGKGEYTQCQAKENNELSFCICNGLLSSAGYNPETEDPLYTAGAIAWRIEGTTTVKELIAELTGATPSSFPTAH